MCVHMPLPRQRQYLNLPHLIQIPPSEIGGTR